MMNEWQEYRLGDLGKVITGKTPSKKHPGDWGDEMPFVTPTDYQDFRKRATSTSRYLSDDGINRLSQKVLPPCSIMVTCIGSDMGKVAINVLPVITNQQINSIIPNTNLVCSDFLYYRLVSMYDTLRAYGRSGTAVPIVNKGDFENLTAKIPTLSEQEAITAVLASLDDKIDLLHRQNKTLESLAQTLFRHWFIDNADDEWEIGTLSDLGKVVTGKTPSTKNKEYWGEEIEFVTPTDFRNYGKYAEGTSRYLSRRGKVKVQKSIIPQNSILVTCIGSDMGKVAISTRECVTNQQINSLVLHDPQKYAEFAYQYLKSIYSLLRSMALGGTTMPIINKTDFSNIEITIPPDECLTKFNIITNSFNEKIANNIKQIGTLGKLRDTFLPKLMSGEVRVRQN